VIKLDYSMTPSPAFLAKRFEGLRREMRDWKDAWRRMLPGISAEQKSSFGKTGVSWPALKQSTLRKKGSKRETLAMTGKLKRSVGKKLSLRKMSMKVGTRLKYAASHQFGYKKKNIPARPFIGLTPRMERHIGESMRAEMIAKIKRSISG